jgi:hypothetical protein
MNKNNKKNDIIIIPPGYEYVGTELQNDGDTSLQVMFLDSVDGTFLDADNYKPETPELEQADLPQGFKDYAPQV